eukprot:gb/GEZJ01000085.1/.p1 GENE.gb/GEZJ01000085.1/~~gb/GEZJ01000085.1/.p1  ORF type:complete len:870 (-),score=129.14 gb/GEZJ01000085.1/:6169-8643(-)
MSLDIIDLRVLTESGTDKEKWYARRIMPVRKHGNWLLCTLLIGNTAVNSALAIVTADLFGGIAGFIASTVIILYIGEIIPQAVCHRFGLVVGAHAVPFIRAIMFLSAPLSFTTAKALDFFLGGEPATRYNKSQLKSLLSIHGTVQQDTTSSSSKPQTNEHPAQPGESSPLPVSVANDDQITVIELQQISVHPQQHSPAQPSTTPQTVQTSTRVVTTSTQLAHSTSQKSTPPEATLQPRQRIVPVVPRNKKKYWHNSRFLENTHSRFIRRNHDKKDREKESETSNPPLTKDEITMLGGAFDFSQKTVGQVMTLLNNVFMLEASLSLNFEVMLLVFQSGHSRIPVYDKSRENIIGVLFAKDLILLDPEDSVPIKTVLLFFGRTVLLVFYDTTLNTMLNIFRQGGGHMAIVQKKKEGSQQNPDTIGIVTLEDLIEEIIGQDIVDETDVYTDNISKQRVKRVRSIHPEVLKMFDSKHDEELLSEKEVLVVASYLSNNTDEFAQNVIDTNVLRKVLAEISIVKYPSEQQNVPRATLLGNVADATTAALAGELVVNRNTDAIATKASGDIASRLDASARATGTGRAQALPDATIYSRGVPTKNAFLIINGRLEISAGNDGFKSEAGPWTFLGTRALTEDIYAPDFTARVIERPARLLRISRKLYRVMKQYTATGTSWASPKKGGLNDGPFPPLRPTLTQSSRRVLNSSNDPPPSSLALAAAATAVAVGAPKSGEEGPSLSGTASETTVVKKARSRPGGRSIQWSEMGPSISQVARSNPESRKAQSSPDIFQDVCDNDKVELDATIASTAVGIKRDSSQNCSSHLRNDEEG